MDDHGSKMIINDIWLNEIDPHAACFPLQPSYIAANGERVAPIAAMVANFTKP